MRNKSIGHYAGSNSEPTPLVNAEGYAPGGSTWDAPRVGSNVRASSTNAETSILGLMWHGKWTMAFCIALALVAGLAYLEWATPLYTSSSVLYVQQERPSNAPPRLNPKPLDTARLAAHRRMLMSNPVLSAAVNHPQVSNANVLAGVEDGHKADALRDMLEIRPGGDEQIIRISMSTTEPQEAATIVNQVVWEYLEHQRRERANEAPSEAHAENQPPTHKHPNAAPASADASGGELHTESANANRIPFIAASEQVVAQRLQQLSNRLTEAEMAHDQAQSLLRSARNSERDVAALGQLLSAAGLQSASDRSSERGFLAERLARLRDRKSSLGQTLGSNHHQMKSLQGRIDQTKARLEQLRLRTSSTLLARLGEHERTTAQRQRQIQAAFNRQQQAARSIESLPVQVIDSARPATKPSSPKASRVLPLALVGGVMLGTVVILGRDFYDHDQIETTRRSQETLLANAKDVDVGQAQSPMLGVVPETSIPQTGTSDSPEGIPEWDTTASSIHHIRAVLQVRARNHGIKTFAVTSPRRGAGKTSVAMGLASSMALSGTKTLVVDCDLASRVRRRAQTNAGHAKTNGKPLFASAERTSEAPGLVDIAKKRGYVPGSARQMTDTHAAIGVAAMLDGRPMAECVFQSSVENLTIMPVGNVEPDHISRISDRFVEQLLEEASRDYDMILLDTGPVPGSVEALLTCSRAEGVLMVAAQGEARQHFEKALSYLKVVGATLAGTIFNRAGREQGPKAGRSKHAKAQTDESPDASFIPKARERPAPSSENYGSGLLAAAVFSGRSETNAQEGLRDAADEDESTWELDADSVVSGLDIDEDDGQSKENSHAADDARRPGVNGSD